MKELRDKGLTFEQVVREMGVSKSAVKRAVAKLRQLEAESEQRSQEGKLRALATS